MGGRQFQDRHAAAIRCQSSHTKRVPHLGSVRSHCACRRRFRSSDAAESPVSQGGFSRRKPAAAARTPRTIERDAVFSRLPEQNHHIRVACRSRKMPRFDFVPHPFSIHKIKSPRTFAPGHIRDLQGTPSAAARSCQKPEKHLRKLPSLCLRDRHPAYRQKTGSLSECSPPNTAAP